MGTYNLALQVTESLNLAGAFECSYNAKMQTMPNDAPHAMSMTAATTMNVDFNNMTGSIASSMNGIESAYVNPMTTQSNYNINCSNTVFTTYNFDGTIATRNTSSMAINPYQYQIQFCPGGMLYPFDLNGLILEKTCGNSQVFILGGQRLQYTQPYLEYRVTITKVNNCCYLIETCSRTVNQLSSAVDVSNIEARLTLHGKRTRKICC